MKTFGLNLGSTATNVKWVLVTQAGVRLLAMARGIVLARLLSPVDFGIVGMAMMLHTMVKQFADMGIGSATVYFQRNSDEILPVAVVIKCIFGFVVAGIIFLIAPLWASFFGRSEVASVTQVSALLVFVQVLSFPAQVQAQIRLRFREMSLPAVTGTAIGCIVAVLLAFGGFSYWSIVWGLLSGKIVEMVLLIRAFPWKVRLSWNSALARELLRYGLPLIGASGIYFITLQMDNFVVGKLLDLTALGYYLVAFRWAHFGSYELAAGIGSVLFPTFSHWRAKDRDPVDRFEMVLRISAVIYLPIAVGMILIAPEFVRLLLGERWLPVVIPLQVLCVAGIFRAVGSAAGKLLQAIGHPEVEFRVQVAFLLVLSVFLVPLTLWFGVIGASISVLLAVVSCYLVMRILTLRQITGLGFVVIGRALTPSVTASALMTGAVLITKSMFTGSPPGYASLILAVALGGTFYVSTILFLFGKELNLLLSPGFRRTVS